MAGNARGISVSGSFWRVSRRVLRQFAPVLRLLYPTSRLMQRVMEPDKWCPKSFLARLYILIYCYIFSVFGTDYLYYVWPNFFLAATCFDEKIFYLFYFFVSGAMIRKFLSILLSAYAKKEFNKIPRIKNPYRIWGSGIGV